MKQRVDSVLQETAVDLARHGFDTAFVNRGVAADAGARHRDRGRPPRAHGGVHPVIDFLIAHGPANVIEALENSRRTLQVQFDRWYARPDAPYLATNAILERLQQGLRRGERCEDLVARAAAELEDVAFDGSPEDSAVKIGGTCASKPSMRLTTGWRRGSMTSGARRRSSPSSRRSRRCSGRIGSTPRLCSRRPTRFMRILPSSPTIVRRGCRCSCW